ncbi:hypothetical protein B0H11DRAFT_1922232 [Mycena galericulata]|nr:hypothetical protein B0H11DRAFT_1922232 [Mycena galericulata]
MAKLASLPPELLLVILSFLDTGDLWALAQVSRGFQSLALFPLLATYHLSASQIHSGRVDLPGKASYLVPRIYRIQRIQTLSIFHQTMSLRTLTSILSTTPKIPHIILRLPTAGLDSSEVARLISPLYRAIDPVMIMHIRDGRGSVDVEPPRCGIPNPIHPAVSAVVGCICSPPKTITIITGLVWIPLVAIIICFFHLLSWIGWWCVGPKWNMYLGIAHHLGWTDSASIQVQALSLAKGVRLIVFNYDVTPLKTLSIRDDSYLWRFPEQQKAFFATLCFPDTLETLDFENDSRVSLRPLLDCVRRHPSIRTLEFGPRSLPRSSLTVGPSRTDAVNVTSLTAPVLYIPSLRSTVRGVETLKLRLDAHTRYDTYVRALAAIDSAWPVHTLALDLYDTPSPHALPWRANANAGTEARLNTIRILEIHHFGFTGADIAPLARWLTRFPGLVRVQLDARRAVRVLSPAVPMTQSAILSRSIAEALDLPLP